MSYCKDCGGKPCYGRPIKCPQCQVKEWVSRLQQGHNFVICGACEHVFAVHLQVVTSVEVYELTSVSGKDIK